MKFPRIESSLRHLCLPVLIFLLTGPALATDTVIYPVAPLPVGVNPATYPTPREEWFIKFQGNVDKTKGHQYDLLFDGDSITDFWQTRGIEVWNQHFGRFNPVDFGISGDKTENVLWRLKEGQVDGMDPKLIVLMIGTNNLAHYPVGEIADGVKAIVAQYLQRCPHSHLLLLGVFPRSAKPTDAIRAKVIALNKGVASLDDGKRVTYLDIGQKFLQSDGTLTAEIMPDFLHPSPKGYAIWADAIQPIVDKYCSTTASATAATTPTATMATTTAAPVDPTPLDK